MLHILSPSCVLDTYQEADGLILVQQGIILSSYSGGLQNSQSTQKTTSLSWGRAMQVEQSTYSKWMIYYSFETATWECAFFFFFVCAGHYVPQLAQLIVQSNTKFNLKGIAVSIEGTFWIIKT